MKMENNSVLNRNHLWLCSTSSHSNIIFMKLVLFLLLLAKCGTYASPVRSSLVSSPPVSRSSLEPYAIRTTFRDNKHALNENDYSSVDDYLNSLLNKNQDDDIRAEEDRSDALSANVGNRHNGGSQRRLKKALSLFAHWRPGLHNENGIPSDVVSAVARGHSRPVGGPLRWG